MIPQRLSREYSRDWQVPPDDDRGVSRVDADKVTRGLFDLRAGDDGEKIMLHDLPPRHIVEQMELVAFPRNEMVVTCKTCGSLLRLRTQRLIAEHGRKEKIADVISTLSRICTGPAEIGCTLLLETEQV